MMAEAFKEYEAILIAPSELNPEAVTQLQNQFGELVARQGGRVLGNTLLGTRKLSYKVGRHQEGHYLQVKLQMPPSGIEGLKRSAALDESIIRMMVVKATDVPPPVFRPTDSYSPELDTEV